MRKKLIISLLIGVISIGTVLPTTITMANEVTECSQFQNEITNREVEVTSISEEEYISRVAKYENISFDEAKNLIENEHEIAIDNIIKNNLNDIVRSGKDINKIKEEIGRVTEYKQVGYVDYLASSSLAKCEVRSGFIVAINSGGNYQGILSASDPYVMASGNNPFRWEQANLRLIKHSANHVQLLASGNVSATVSSSISGSAQAQWLDCGFSVTAGVSGQTHIRKFHNINKNYKLYY